MSEVTRFDLEQEILRCWTITNDLKVFAEMCSDSDQFNSLADNYEIHFEKLWKTFETLIQEGKIK